jgi:hypothetical protein
MIGDVVVGGAGARGLGVFALRAFQSGEVILGWSTGGGTFRLAAD